MPTKITLLYVLAGYLYWQSQNTIAVRSHADSYRGGSFNANVSGLKWSNWRVYLTKEHEMPVNRDIHHPANEIVSMMRAIPYMARLLFYHPLQDYASSSAVIRR